MSPQGRWFDYGTGQPIGYRSGFVTAPIAGAFRSTDDDDDCECPDGEPCPGGDPDECD